MSVILWMYNFFPKVDSFWRYLIDHRNAMIYYPTSSVSNISIDKSLEITSKAEQNAVLDVIIESPYYDESIYGSKGFMRAQWVAHNLSHVSPKEFISKHRNAKQVVGCLEDNGFKAISQRGSHSVVVMLKWSKILTRQSYLTMEAKRLLKELCLQL